MAQPGPVAPQRQEDDYFIAQVDEELDTIQSMPDEGWGKYNLLSLGSLKLTTYICTTADHAT